MKKIYLLLMVTVGLLFLTGCGTAKPVLTPPQSLSQPEWVVPESVQRQSATGDVFRAVIEIFMDENGVPESIVMKNDSGNKDLDRYILRNAKKMRFKPGLADGKPVRSRAIVPLEFRMQ